jgi:hypothetical protein
MADVVKVIFQFALPGSGGWGEVFYRPGTPHDPLVEAACNRWVAKRLLPLVQIARIKGYRISAVPTTRTSKHFRLRAATGTPGPADTRDQATTGIATTLRCAGGQSRPYIVRGCPDGYLVYDVAGNQGAPPAGLTSYLAYLSGGGGDQWGMQAEHVHAGDPALVTGNVLDVTGGQVTFTFAGLAIVPGQRFVVSGGDGFKVSQFRGTFRCRSYASPNLIAGTRRLLDPSFVQTDPFQVRVKSPTYYDYPIFNSYDAGQEIAASKRVGREPDQPRGRSSRGR